MHCFCLLAVEEVRYSAVCFQPGPCSKAYRYFFAPSQIVVRHKNTTYIVKIDENVQKYGIRLHETLRNL